MPSPKFIVTVGIIDVVFVTLWQKLVAPKLNL
jgi:hypothetical protein